LTLTAYNRIFTIHDYEGQKLVYKKITESHKEMADFAKALSHPARLMILQILAELKSCMCQRIVDKLPLSQSTVSQHLKELKRVGLIKGEIDGPKICYCIDYEVFNKAREQFHQLFQEINDISNCC